MDVERAAGLCVCLTELHIGWSVTSAAFTQNPSCRVVHRCREVGLCLSVLQNVAAVKKSENFFLFLLFTALFCPPPQLSSSLDKWRSLSLSCLLFEPEEGPTLNPVFTKSNQQMLLIQPFKLVCLDFLYLIILLVCRCHQPAQPCYWSGRLAEVSVTKHTRRPRKWKS